MRNTIVAEISKSWVNGESAHRTPLISQQFESVIDSNRARGYELRDWRFHQFSHIDQTNNGHMTETIIAVFEKSERIHIDMSLVSEHEAPHPPGAAAPGVFDVPSDPLGGA